MFGMFNVVRPESERMVERLSRLEQDGAIVELFIDEYSFPDDAAPTETWGILTDCYEIGGKPSELSFKEDLVHSIDDVDGSAFRLEAAGPVEVRFISILTDWVYDDDGEVEDIIIPDEPYDKGSVTLEPGDYRVWDEVTKSEDTASVTNA